MQKASSWDCVGLVKELEEGRARGGRGGDEDDIIMVVALAKAAI